MTLRPSQPRPLPSLDGSSYYAATAHPRPAAAELQGDATAEVAVVGGGIAGLCAALELARQGAQVTLLESGRIGCGASGRNGGQALGDFACGIEALERRLGAAAAQQAWQCAQQALHRLRQRIAEHAIDCDWRNGALTVAADARQAAALQAAMRHRQQVYGATHLRWLEAAELRQHVASSRYRGGVLDPMAGHLHPLNYTLGLARAARRLGVTVHEGSQVLQLHGEGGRHVLRCAGGRLRAARLLLATGAVPGAPLARLRARVLPVASCMLATEALREPVVPREVAVCDSAFIPDYYRQSADGRLLFGSGAHHAGAMLHDAAERRRRLRSAMLRVFPQLQDTAITHDWGGWIDVSVNRAPDFGRVGAAGVYLQGFSGHGLALAGLAGELGARALLGGPGSCPEFELFARLPHAALPTRGWLRVPVGMLGSLWGRLQHTVGG